MNNRKWIAATLVSLGLVAAAPASVIASEAELLETKAKTEALMKENEELALRIKELEEKAFSKDSRAEDLDKEIKLIKAKLDTSK